MQAVCQYPLPPVDYSPELDMNTGHQEENPQPVIVKGTLGFIAHRLGVPPWGQILVLALLAVIGLGYRHLDKMDEHFIAVDKTLATLPLGISNTLLSQAQTDVKLGRYDRATRATEAAKAILAKASVDKIAAPPGYFEEALSAMNVMKAIATDESFRGTVHGAQLLLADYRSALEPLPRGRPSTKTAKATVLASEISQEKGTTLVFDSANPDSELIKGPAILQDLTIVAPHGGYILLDGLHLDTVVLVGVRVQYLGGPIDLHYVRFVNCTFDSVPDGNGPRLIDYVALAQNKLSTQS